MNTLKPYQPAPLLGLDMKGKVLMAQRLWRRSSRVPAVPADKLDQQISVGFLPSIGELIDVVARQRGTTTSKLLGETVAILVTEAEKNPNVIGYEVRSYTHRLPAIVDGDRHVTDTSPAPRHGPRPQYTRRLSIYLTEDVADRLDRLCAETDIGRARMVRLAVDKYLFEEIVNARLGHISMVGSR